MENNEEKNNYKELNIMKNTFLINPSLNKEIIQDKTFTFSNIKSKNYLFKKIDSKSQTSSNFLYNNLYLRNNYSNKNQYNINNIYFSQDIFSDDNRNNNLLINTIQLDKNNLRLISNRSIKNKQMSILDKINNNSDFFNSQYYNTKKNRIDIVKYRFLLSKKNYFKRINNLKENNILINNINNLNLKLNEYKNNKTINKINFLLLNNHINEQVKKNNIKKNNSSFPSINNSIHKSLFDIVNKNNSSINIKIKNENINNDNKRNNKLLKSINHKCNFFSHRDSHKINIDNKEDNSINKKIYKNNSFETKNIINDQYNKYLDDISSSESNKSKEKNDILNSVNKNMMNKILASNLKYKNINIKNGIFNLNKNKLNISFKDNQKNKMNRLSKNNYFKPNNIKPIIKIKKITIDNEYKPEINKNVILNLLLREKLFQNK